MSIKTKEELRQYWNTNINTNGVQAITGSKMNVGGIDIIDSVVFTADTSTGLVNWKNKWEFGEYYKNDAVLDGSWLMIANKTTTDPAAPQATGEADYIFPDAMAWEDSSATASFVTSGQRYTIQEPGYITGYRVWIPTVGTGFEYQVVLVNRSSGSPVFKYGNKFAPNNKGWLAVAIDPTIVVEGNIFDLLLLSYNHSSGTGTQANYDYVTPQNLTLPNSGQAVHGRSTPEQMYISHTDSGSVDRTALLQSMEPGDTIQFSTIKYTVISATDQGTYHLFEVTPDVVGVAGSYLTTFYVNDDGLCPYVINSDYLLTYTSVKGLWAIDTTDITLSNDNAYGTDLLLQPASVSPDWDIMSSMGAGSGSGGGIYDAGFTAIGLVIDDTGDDKGMSITEGQLSTGTRGAGREVAFGEGDSYPVDTAYHTKLVDISGLVVSNATDVTDILQSDSGSTTGFFGGTGVGGILLVGSDYPFTGLKVKYATLSILGSEGIVAEYLRDNTPTWQEIGFMSAQADWKYIQYGNSIGNESNASEHIRFGYKDPKIVPDVWDKVTLTINGTPVTKYWGRMRIETAISSDPTVEQVKQHTNHWECNKDGVTEYFGLSRPPFSLNIGMFNNADYTPLDANVAIAANITVVSTGNELANVKIDGTIIIGKIPIGMDTSIPVELIVNWYQTNTASGDVELEVESVNILPDFIYQGNAQTQASTPVITSLTGQQYRTNTSSFLINVETLLPGDKLIASLFRDATSGNPDDTLVGNIVIVHSEMIGYRWR